MRLGHVGQLRRALGALNLTTLGIGAIIGAGIFAAIGTAISGDSGHVGIGLLVALVVLLVVFAGSIPFSIGGEDAAEPADDLEAHRQALGEAAGDREPGQACEVDGQREEVAGVHRERVGGAGAELERDRRRGRADEQVELAECRRELVADREREQRRVAGLAEQLGSVYIPTYAIVVTFLIMVLVLAVRPQGLLAGR